MKSIMKWFIVHVIIPIRPILKWICHPYIVPAWMLVAPVLILSGVARMSQTVALCFAAASLMVSVIQYHMNQINAFRQCGFNEAAIEDDLAELGEEGRNTPVIKWHLAHLQAHRNHHHYLWLCMSEFLGMMTLFALTIYTPLTTALLGSVVLGYFFFSLRSVQEYLADREANQAVGLQYMLPAFQWANDHHWLAPDSEGRWFLRPLLRTRLWLAGSATHSSMEWYLR